MNEHVDKPADGSPASKAATWNSAEDIARHRLMSPADRWRKAVNLSQAAQRLARAERIDGR